MAYKERFSQLYSKEEEIVKDDKRFRIRLASFIQEEFKNFELGSSIIKICGVKPQLYSIGYDIEKFIESAAIADVLDVITIAVQNTDCHKKYTSGDVLISFVNQCFSECNLCYMCDDKGVVHYNPDEDFYLTKQSTLRCLEPTRYTAVLAEFIKAHDRMDFTPPDTKGAITAIFESLEILTKLITKQAGKSRLNGELIKNHLLPIVSKCYSQDKVAEKVAQGFLTAFVEWITPLHHYRHGQPIETKEAPPIGLATYVISSGTAHLRWLVEIDQMHQSG